MTVKLSLVDMWWQALGEVLPTMPKISGHRMVVDPRGSIVMRDRKLRTERAARQIVKHTTCRYVEARIVMRQAPSFAHEWLENTFAASLVVVPTLGECDVAAVLVEMGVGVPPSQLAGIVWTIREEGLYRANTLRNADVWELSGVADWKTRHLQNRPVLLRVRELARNSR
jgi:hypothetical protein